MCKSLFEYFCGRLIFMKNSNRAAKTDKSRISHGSEDCPWVSEKTTVYTRMTKQEILTMMFTYPDRRMDFNRYIAKIDNAVKKLDLIIAQNSNSKPLKNRRHLLLTGKEIYMAISQNFNAYRPDEEQISLLDYGKRIVKKLMFALADDQNKQNAFSCSDSDSSDSRTNTQLHQEYEPYFDKVLNDYFGNESKGRLQNRLEQYLDCDERSMEKNCIAFKKMIDDYRQKLKNPNLHRSKVIDYLARLFLVEIAHSTLRQASSSSCLERKFADAMRSLERKRVKLTPEHVGSEVLIRSLYNEKQSLQQLAEILKHDSDDYQRLISTLTSIHDDDEEYDDVSLFFNENNTI